MMTDQGSGNDGMSRLSASEVSQTSQERKGKCHHGRTQDGPVLACFDGSDG